MKYRYLFQRGGWIISIPLFILLTGCYIGTTSLSGFLLDRDTLEPISGAHLFFVERLIYSEENGHFFFPSIPYGLHTLYVKVPFYKDEEYLVNIDRPYYTISSPLCLAPFHWETEGNNYLYKEDGKFDIFSSYDGVNFSEEKLLLWGNDLIDKMDSIVDGKYIVPFSIFTDWPDDEVQMEEIMAFTIYSKGEIHILGGALDIENEDFQREIFAHEFTHLFLYRYAHIKEPFIQEGLAFYFPSFVLGYGKKYDYSFYKRGLVYYLTPSYIPGWKEAGEIYSHPHDKKIFWFSLYVLRSIFYFLADQYGKERVNRFFLELKESNNDFDTLFSKVFGKGIAELEVEWRDYFSLLDSHKKIKKLPKPFIY